MQQAKTEPLQIFQVVPLSRLIKPEMQLVPEGVWLKFKPACKLRLKLYQLNDEQGAPQAKVGEYSLDDGQEFVLQASQCFRLEAENSEVPGPCEGSGPNAGIAEFLTIPNLYFTKKYNNSDGPGRGLGQPHSEVAYLKAHYCRLHPDFEQRALQVLDLGCGRGRNALVFAGDPEQNYRVLGLDQNEQSLAAWRSLAQSEGLEPKMRCRQVNLNHWRREAPHDIAMAIVSLQFIEAASELLRHCMAQASLGALHLLVFPVADTHPNVIWPGGFQFVPQSEELKTFYIKEGWSILEYRENYGHLGKIAEDGLPKRGPFATLIAQKIGKPTINRPDQ